MDTLRRHIANIIVAFITVAATGVFSATIVRAVVYAPGEPEMVMPAQSANTYRPHHLIESTSLPRRIIIPAIGVDAEVEPVGIGMSGSMAVPHQYDAVGWYKLGTPPGEVGSAVMAGHVTDGLLMPGVFNRIPELLPGDEIVIITDSDETLHFNVTKTETYPLSVVPLDELFYNERQGAAGLNLITCQGDWLSEEQTYDKRIVVYAELQEETSTTSPE